MTPPLVISIIAFAVVLTSIVWIALIRKELFDPRLYVLYGVAHWVLVPQVAMLTGLTIFEVRPEFPRDLHMKVSLTILAAVLAFLAGYRAAPFRLRHIAEPCLSDLPSVDSRRLVAITLTLAVIGESVLIASIRGMRLRPEFLLPLTYFVVAASLLTAYTLFTDAVQPRQRRLAVTTKVLLAIALILAIITTNVAVVFPFFGILYWICNRGYPQRTIGPRVLLLVMLLYTSVGLTSIFVKLSQMPEGAGSVLPLEGGALSLERLMARSTLENALMRIVTLDIFNMEGYGVILSSADLYPESGRLLFGKSFLVLLPFLRFIWPSAIRGFGRLLVLDVYGPSYEYVNVSWAVSPIGELIANFGYAAPVLGYFFIGVLSRWLYRSYLRCPNQTHLVGYSAVLPWLFLQQRGDVLNGNLYPLYVILILYAVMRLSRVRARGPNAPATRAWRFPA